MADLNAYFYNKVNSNQYCHADSSKTIPPYVWEEDDTARTWDMRNKLVKYAKRSRLLTLSEARALIAQKVGESSYDEASFKTTYKSTVTFSDKDMWVAVGDENSKDYV